MRLYANFLYLKLIKIDITFLLLSMPNKRNHHPLNKLKSAVAIYLEECHAFDSGQSSSLTHGNIWHYLVNHQFERRELTSLLLPHYTDNVNEHKQSLCGYLLTR